MNLLFDYIVALTNLNGVIHKEKVVEIYNMQNEIVKEVSDIEAVMMSEEVNLRKHYVEVEGSYFVHESIFYFDEMEPLLQTKAGKPYYIPDKKLLLRYKDDKFYEENKQTKKLYRFLKKYVQPDNVNSVGDVFYDVLMYCAMEISPAEIITHLDQIGVTFPTEKELKEALRLIVDLSNNTRLWGNNGFTPRELFEKFEKPNLKSLPDGNGDFNTSMKQPKVGRNDPCPCRSGKKYKKCCLVKG